MAGNNRGSWFIPDVDDEVLVAFEGGDPRRPYVLGGLAHVTHRVGELLDTGARVLQEAPDRGVGAQGCEELDEGTGVPDGQHGLLHALILVGLAMCDFHAEHRAMEVDGRVQIGDGDTDVVDGEHPGLHVRHRGTRGGGPA